VKAPTQQERAARPYDVVVWGATGFTGRLVAEYVVQRYGVGRGVAWAIAGRSKEKLDAVRDALASIDPAARDLPLLVGDSRDVESLAPIVRSTRVIATTVGPYAIYGRELVAACSQHGTDCCDLTGEPQFVRAMIEDYDAQAKASGARIVNCCGFDSIPSDLGVLFLQTEMQARHGTRCAEVKYFLAKMRGGFSGGTAASVITMADQMAADPAIRRLIANPYSLDLERRDRGPDGPDQHGVRWDADMETWTGPFMMAAINTRIVRRSNALLGYRYGRDFRYSECQAFAPGPRGFLQAAAMTSGVTAFLAAAALGPTRKLLASALPAPGEGPSKKQRDSGFFVVKLVGIGAKENGARVRLLGTVRGVSDPGYGETAKMLSESALSLAQDPRETGGGVLTPASCMGMRLVERLRTAGMTFDVEPMA
jgi:short subunit dehydrogenase-like uncharacterized protein